MHRVLLAIALRVPRERMRRCAPRDTLYAEAQQAMAADDFEAAARHYQELTIQAPDSPYGRPRRTMSSRRSTTFG